METTITTDTGVMFSVDVADHAPMVHLTMSTPRGGCSGWMTPSEAMDLADRLREYAHRSMSDR